MPANTKIGSMKRLEARYGRKTRERVGIIEAELHKKHICPNCRTPNVKRVFVGVWQCRKCGHKFTSKAFTVDKTPSIKDSNASQEQEMPEPTPEIQAETQEQVAAE